jgi:hypothetical protein
MTTSIIPPPPIGNDNIASDEWQSYLLLQQRAINAISTSNNTLGTMSAQNTNAVAITGGSITGTTLAGSTVDCTTLRCDSIRVDDTPVTGVLTGTHYLPINLNGTTYYILLHS